MLISVAAISRALGSQYELKGSRKGLLLAILGVISYLVGTSVSSDVLHLLAITLFYWGCVLQLGGTRPLVSALPAGLIVVSLFAPRISPLWGLAYIEGLSWGVIVVSSFLLLNSRKSPEPLGCGFCSSCKERGESFCLSCGRLIGSSTIRPSRRGFSGVIAFTIIMTVLLTTTMPLMTVGPAASFASIGLGGVQSSGVFPLPGWRTEAPVPAQPGEPFSRYILTNGATSIEAYVSLPGDSQSAAAALDAIGAKFLNGTTLPPSIANRTLEYTVSQDGVPYIGLQGVFKVGILNGSTLSSAFVAVDLQEAASSFSADKGLALYGASNALINWTSASAYWTPVATALLSVYQLFSQMVYLSSFGAVVVILFAVARDDELAKARRQESAYTLTGPELAITEAFASGPEWRTGEEIQEQVRKSDKPLSDATFHWAIEDLARRGLVSRSVAVRKGRPTLLWKCFL